MDSVDDIDLQELRCQGIRAVILDLDNTLVPWHKYDIPPRVASWVQALKDADIKACIVSNTNYPKRLRQIAETLGIAYATRGMKPRRAGFREALRMLNTSISETAVIGDQIFTDILGGNRLGVLTILVMPIQKKEFFGTKLTRFFEGIILRELQKRKMIGFSRSESQASGEQSVSIDRQ